MQQLIQFPDVERMLVDYLDETLTARSMPAHVGTMVPNPRPAKFVRVQRLGGTRAGLVVSTALVTVEAWADAHADAWALIALCEAAVHALEGETTDYGTVYRVTTNAGPANLPDPDSDARRFVATFEVAVRGDVI